MDGSLNKATVDKATISTSTGAITVTGTIACTVGEAFSIYDSIVQVSGRKYAVTNGFFFGTCTGNTEPWTNGEPVLFGSIKTGNADVVVQIFESPVRLARSISGVRARPWCRPMRR
jgi:Family of unknown function (DUF6299)